MPEPDMLHQLQAIRWKLIELQTCPWEKRTPELMFEKLGALVTLCDQAIDFEIHNPR
jgi:hypothetical protein